MKTAKTSDRKLSEKTPNEGKYGTSTAQISRSDRDAVIRAEVPRIVLAVRGIVAGWEREALGMPGSTVVTEKRLSALAKLRGILGYLQGPGRPIKYHFLSDTREDRDLELRETYDAERDAVAEIKADLKHGGKFTKEWLLDAAGGRRHLPLVEYLLSLGLKTVKSTPPRDLTEKYVAHKHEVSTKTVRRAYCCR